MSCVFAASVFAQDFDDEESPRKPGLTASYTADGGQTATRIDETLAFDWQTAAPDERLPEGSFGATWRGRLWTQTPGIHRLHIHVQGVISVKLGGKEVVAGRSEEPQWFSSEPLDLPFDYHLLEIAYRKLGEQARVALYWSGPNFVLEPVPERFLFHDRTESPSQAFERGRQLAAALRCEACHRNADVDADAAAASAAMPAPALDKLAGNVSHKWLVEWLGGEGDKEQGKGDSETGGSETIVRRMPHFGMKREEAEAVAGWLLRSGPAAEGNENRKIGDRKIEKQAAGKEKPAKPSQEQGERLFLTLGCLACHQHGELGESGLFGGGDLTNIAAKRPAAFFDRWLAEPASLNKHHRMPVFDLSADERASLVLWLAQQSAVGNALRGVPEPAKTPSSKTIAQGEQLVAQFRCAACHSLPEQLADAPAHVKPLSDSSDWTQSCAGEPGIAKSRPGYRLAEDDRDALREFFSAARPVEGTPRRAFPTAPQTVGRDLLVQLNCLACHQREGIDRTANMLPARLQDKLAAVAEMHSHLAKELPAMTPPALNSVGDKLHDAALAAAIRREGPPHRPYLLARMPKFNLTDEQLAALTAYFVATDRIRSNPQSQIPNPKSPVAALAAAGPRLVTTDGFGCTSCHQVGSVKADKAPLNARGPSLSMLDKRIRREWFDRWCNSPARIVPRMEMPSVQVPVRGVLGDNVHDQLAAVWHTLNTPGFEPPEPNPVRVLRLSGVPDRKESPIVLHDVVKDGDKTYLFPLVIGLPNRHNILFDLETNRLAAWWLGDTARQRTKGKSWYWEVGGLSLLPTTPRESDLAIVMDGEAIAPLSEGQFIARLDETYSRDAKADKHIVDQSVAFRYQLTFPIPLRNRDRTQIDVTERFAPLTQHPSIVLGYSRSLIIAAPGAVRLRLVDSATAARSSWDVDTRTLALPGEPATTITVAVPHEVHWNSEGTITFFSRLGREELLTGNYDAVLHYKSSLPPDEYVTAAPPPLPLDARSLDVMPGISAWRLPFNDDITPTAIAWKPTGELLFSTLKGQIFQATDSDNDGVEGDSRLLADGLPTPYGLVAGRKSVSVVAKSALLQIEPRTDSRGLGVLTKVSASGWGMTDDYHDWAVGLVPGDDGEYYMALPCQQDKRSEAAAKHRGQFLKLVPRAATPDNPRLFDIEVVSSGHRFPMGIAKNRAGDLFVTDNQGNYNPFNELNHVRPGKHFGFINANEKEKGYKAPPLEAPAINIPHPWTRSVNGICFLDTPEGLRDEGKGDIFGPLEGHLIGCEYDTRRLIRMTLQKIGDTYQGAAYPLSIPPEDVEKGLLGPIVCAVKPTTGELYVGEIRDSGWGAGNNVGQIVKIRVEPDKLPCGIAEMRATLTGFTLDFFQPVDAKKAADAANYSLQSYRRESTPAYGGPDLDRRTEKVNEVEVSADGKRVTLTLPELRTGFVYELRLKNLATGNGTFHPDEAHYTLNQIP